jgi:hypothetical protein
MLVIREQLHNRSRTSLFEYKRKVRHCDHMPTTVSYLHTTTLQCYSRPSLTGVILSRVDKILCNSQIRNHMKIRSTVQEFYAGMEGRTNMARLMAIL